MIENETLVRHCKRTGKCCQGIYICISKAKNLHFWRRTRAGRGARAVARNAEYLDRVKCMRFIALISRALDEYGISIELSL